VFGLMRCGIRDPCSLFSCVAGQQKFTLSLCQSRVWIDYGSNVITRLIYFPLLQRWLFLPTRVGNINLHHLVRSKWKISER